VADLDRNLWYCFSGCSAGGDVVDLVRRLYGVGYREAAEILADLARQAPSPALGLRAASRQEPRRHTPPFRPFLRRLRLEPFAPFLAQKGIEPNTARFFEAGAWEGPGFLQGCVGVRLHDPGGRPLGYAGRRLDGGEARWFGKWKMPPRLPKSRILYNAHRIGAALHGGTVALTECPWGVMRLHQLGMPAVALLGVHLTSAQRCLLRRTARVLLVLDADPVGRDATERLRRSLADVAPLVRVLRLPDGKDPDDLTNRDLRVLLEPFFLS